MRILFMGREIRGFLGSAAVLAKDHDVYYANFESDETYEDKLSIELDEERPIKIGRLNFARHSHVPSVPPIPPKIPKPWMRLLRDFSPDVLFCKTSSWWLGHAISEDLSAALINVVASIHGLICRQIFELSRDPRDILTAPAGILYHVMKAYRSSFTLATSKKLKKVFERSGVRRVLVIHSPYVYYQLSEDHMIPRLDRPYVLTIATTARPLGETPTMRIVRGVATRIEVPVFVVGTSQDQLNAIEPKIGRLPDNLMGIGYCRSDRVLSRLYREASCVLCPTLLPGFSNRLYEALHYARPTLTTTIGSDEFDGLKNGIHCMIENDFGKYPTLINEITSNESLAQSLAAGAGEYYERTFSPEKHEVFMNELLHLVGER
jgi:glycosyltransferase involved in cell wall biosynthesis